MLEKIIMPCAGKILRCVWVRGTIADAGCHSNFNWLTTGFSIPSFKRHSFDALTM